MKRLPDFGKELRPDLGIHENCYDCTELYWGCPACHPSSVFECGDFRRLPDLRIDGKTGQEIPPSRTVGRNEPGQLPQTQTPTRGRPQPASTPARRQTPAKHKSDASEAGPIETLRPTALESALRELQGEPAEQTPAQTRRRSPAASRGPSGARFWEGGAPVPKRNTVLG
jgi:hypothetical protein